jgi:hypothetical protein
VFADDGEQGCRCGTAFFGISVADVGNEDCLEDNSYNISDLQKDLKPIIDKLPLSKEEKKLKVIVGTRVG